MWRFEISTFSFVFCKISFITLFRIVFVKFASGLFLRILRIRLILLVKLVTLLFFASLFEGGNPPGGIHHKNPSGKYLDMPEGFLDIM